MKGKNAKEFNNKRRLQGMKMNKNKKKPNKQVTLMCSHKQKDNTHFSPLKE
jgi:hypothetical protein